MAGYILILAILILGGVIATVGDRIGTRVGKARLSLFKLRPRKTAVLVTILTGGVISATTLGILLATSRELRDGILYLEQIKDERQAAQKELAQAQTELKRVESELGQSRTELRDISTLR